MSGRSNDDLASRALVVLVVAAGPCALSGAALARSGCAWACHFACGPEHTVVFRLEKQSSMNFAGAAGTHGVPGRWNLAAVGVHGLDGAVSFAGTPCSPLH